LYDWIRTGKELKEIYSNSGGDYLLSGRRVYVGVNHRPHEVQMNDWPVRLTDNVEVGFWSDDIGMRWEFDERDCLEKVVYRPGSVEYYRTFDWLQVKQVYFVPMNKEGFIEMIELRNNSDKGKTINVLVQTVFHIQYYHLLCAPAGTDWEKAVRFEFATVEPDEQQDPAPDFCTFSKEYKAIIAHDNKRRNWTAIVGTNLSPVSHRLADFDRSQVSAGKIAKTADEISSLEEKPVCCLQYSIKLPARGTERVVLVISTSLESENDALGTYINLQKNAEDLLRETEEYYVSFLENTALIETPDLLLDKIFLWNKLTVEYLKQYTPGIGTGYHCSFSQWQNYFGRDNLFLLRGSIEAGDFEGAKEQLEMYARFQHPSGEIFHEFTPTGVSVSSDTDSTPLFVANVHHYLTWTGDVPFVKRIYENVKKAIVFLETLDFQKNGLIATRGEHSCWGSEPTHPNEPQLVDQIYAHAALAAASEMASTLGKNVEANAWREKAELLKEDRINSSSYYWSPENGYFKKTIGDFEPRSLAIWPCMGILFESIDEEKAERVMGRLHGDEFNHDFGFLLASRLREDFPKIIWPWVSGIANLCEFRMHFTQEAFLHLSNMAKKVVTRYYPGSASDVVDAETNEPKQWPIFAWHIGCAILAPVIEGMFGVKPEMHKDVLTIDPHMPYQWPYMRLKNLRVGNYTLDVSFERGADEAKISIDNRAESPITVKLGLNFPKGTIIKEVLQATSPDKKTAFSLNETVRDLHIQTSLEIPPQSQEVVMIILGKN